MSAPGVHSDPVNCVPQPLPPADIMAAAAVLFATGGALTPGSGVGQGAASRLGPHALGLESYYAPWILADLAHWATSGISKVPPLLPCMVHGRHLQSINSHCMHRLVAQGDRLCS